MWSSVQERWNCNPGSGVESASWPPAGLVLGSPEFNSYVNNTSNCITTINSEGFFSLNGREAIEVKDRLTMMDC